MYLIVINPDADRGQSILRLPMIKALFRAAKIPYEVFITVNPMDGYNHTLRFCKRSQLLKGIIGMGSDELTQEIVTGMIDAFPEAREGQKMPVPLGILPSRFDNNFVSALAGSKIRAQAKSNREPEVVVKEFFDLFMRGQVRAVDVITANEMSFINIGNVGLDAVIARNAEKIKVKYDDYAYLIAGVKAILKQEPIHLSFEITDGNETEKISGDYLCAVVCNGGFYGTGMRIAPGAKVDDGKITLGLVNIMSRLRTLVVMSQLTNEHHADIKEITFKQCDKLKLTIPPTGLCLDGNLYHREGEITFKVLPQVLDIFV